MLCMCFNGCLWQEARPNKWEHYDGLIHGWKTWSRKHVNESASAISDTDYPHVSFADQWINPPALRRILLTMLHPDPSQRVSMAAIASNRWLKNVECCQIDTGDESDSALDATRTTRCSKNLKKIVQHNHLPPAHHYGHKLIRLPSSGVVN